MTGKQKDSPGRRKTAKPKPTLGALSSGALSGRGLKAATPTLSKLAVGGGKKSPVRPKLSPKKSPKSSASGSIVPAVWPGGRGPPTPEIANPAVASGVEAAFVHATQHMLVKRRMVAKPAVVLDIDDTALIGPDVDQRTHGPVHAFYRKALAANVAVFFVTARSEKEPGNRKETLQQLKECGYSKFEELLMAQRYTTAFTEIKRCHRKNIEKAGYEILVNAGDQWPDLVSDKVPRSILQQAEVISKRKPFIFYNGLEGGTLCIKLWGSSA